MNAIPIRKVSFHPSALKTIQKYYNEQGDGENQSKFSKTKEKEEKDLKNKKINKFISLYLNSDEILKFFKEVLQYDIRSVHRQSLNLTEKRKNTKHKKVNENELNTHTVLLDVFLLTFTVHNSNLEVTNVSVADNVETNSAS